MTDQRFLLVLVFIAAALAGAVHIALRAVEPVSTPPASITSDAPPVPRVPDVAVVMRALKLVTVQIETGVASESIDRSWRGDVTARVIAPVRLYYGVDMSQLGPDRVWRNPLTGGYVLRLPRPVRLATEVLGDAEDANVQVSGTRFRDLAGEYHLGVARTSLYARARAMALSRDDQRQLETTTREQVARLVQAILASDVPVDVIFDDGDRIADAPVAGVAESADPSASSARDHPKDPAP